MFVAVVWLLSNFLERLTQACPYDGTNPSSIVMLVVWRGCGQLASEPLMTSLASFKHFNINMENRFAALLLNAKNE